MTNEPEVWYRYEERTYAAPLDEFDNPCGPSRTTVNLYEFEVIRYTPKGAWLDTWLGERFVLRNARKRYACPTKEEARESFVARKNRQIRILTSQLNKARTAITLVDMPEHTYHVPRR